MRDAIRLFRDVMASAPDELTLMCYLNHEKVPEGAAFITVCFAGDAEEAVRPLRESLPVLSDGLGLGRYLSPTTAISASPGAPTNNPSCEASGTPSRMAEAAIHRSPPCPNAAVAVADSASERFAATLKQGMRADRTGALSQLRPRGGGGGWPLST